MISFIQPLLSVSVSPVALLRSVRHPLSIFILLAVAALAGADDLYSHTGSKEAKAAGINAKTLEPLTELLLQEVNNGTIPNGSVYIWRRGKLAWFTEVGYQDKASKKPVDGNSVYRIFSMTKPVTAVGVMALVERGDVLLSDPLSVYLPEFSKMQVLSVDDQGKNALTPAQNPIRVRDLLTHTDGFTYDFIPSPIQKDYAALGISPGNPSPTGRKHPSLGSMVTDLATLPLLHEPGVAWSYGVGLDVAGRVIEVVSQKNLASFMEDRIFDRLGMKKTAFSLPSRGRRKRTLTTLYTYKTNEDGSLAKPIELIAADEAENSAWGNPPAVMSGGGGLLSTAEDYMKFAVMLLNKGAVGKKKQVLSPRAAEILMADHMSPDYGLGKSPTFTFLYPDANISGIGHGLGGGVYGNYARGSGPYSPGSYFWGGAAGTAFWVDPSEDMAVVFMTQVIVTSPNDPVDRIQAKIAHLVYSSLN